MGSIVIFLCGLIALIVKLTSKNSNDKIEKDITKKAKNNTQNLTYKKTKNYESQAMSYYNKNTYSDYKKALNLFSKAIISSSGREHKLYYYRADVHLKLYILNNALHDINMALKYLDEQDTENITKYLYTKGLIIQKIGSNEDIIDFWKYLISFSKHKCNDCGQIFNKNLSYCNCGSNDFTVIENEYIKNAKKQLEVAENNEINNYMQKIHNIIHNKHTIIWQNIYNVTIAFYSKKKLEVAENNYNIGLNEFYNGNFVKAKEKFEQAVSLAPYNKEYKDCLKQIRKENDKIIAEEKIALGIKELNNGNANNAVKYFDEAIDMYECARYFFLRGKAFLLQSGITLYDKSVYNFNKAISLEPDNSEYYFYCGKAHFSRYKYNEALDCFNKAVELKNNNWEYYYNRGLANYEVGNYADSIDDYFKAISLNYEILQNEDIVYNIKSSIKKVETISNNKEKVKHIKTLITNSNFYLSNEYEYFVENNKSYISQLISSDKYNEAILEINKAIEKNPDDFDLYELKGICYTSLKMYDEALSNYMHSIELCTDDKRLSMLYFFNGCTLAALEKRDEAIVNYTKAIKLDIKDEIFKAENFYYRGISYLCVKDLINAVRDFCVAIMLDNKYTEEIESIITNTDLFKEDYKEKVLNLISTGIHSLAEGIVGADVPLKELITSMLEYDFNVNLQTENIEQMVNKVRKIDI